jgi:hypothetical protein
MLSHGGSAFAFIGLISTFLLLKGRIKVRNLAALAAASALLYLPWVLYQKYYDPPGDRLLKYHLAGAKDLNNRTFAETLITSYQNIGFRGAMNTTLPISPLLPIANCTIWTGMEALLVNISRDGPASRRSMEMARDLRAQIFFVSLLIYDFL